MLEREFQEWVLSIAELGGWRVWHAPMPVRPIGNNRFIPDPRGRGIPDLIMFHADPPRLIFAELKSEDGRVGEAQEEFLAYARAVGVQASGSVVHAFIWRPRNRDLIEEVLLK